MNLFSFLIGKKLIILMRLLGRNANTLPGLVVEKINPGFLNSKLSKLPKGVIVVTGTNGKTTTTKLISEMLKGQGLRVLTNQTGGNFVRGIVSLVIDKSTLTNKLNYDIAVLELDEAHGVLFTKRVKPNGVVALNILRDQMDRFGEIDQTAEFVKRIALSAKDFVVLNTNDMRIANSANYIKNKKVYFYGYDKSLKQVFVGDDQHYSKEVEFTEFKKPDFTLKSFKDNKVVISSNKEIELPLKLNGSFNAINLTAAFATVSAVVNEVDNSKIIESLMNINPAFGRGEVLQLKNGALIQIQLVKNPSGFNQALNLVKGNNFSEVGIIINDNYADGRDVSWLYDVNFESLKKYKILVSGVRYLDMALRLKYLGVNSENISDLKDFTNKISNLNTNQNAIVYCTYTAMLEFRKLLKPYASNFEEVGL